MSTVRIPMDYLACIIVWLTAVVFGGTVLWRYENAPSDSGTVVRSLPTTAVVKSPTGKTVILFVHPRCPCSRASISEFSRLLEQTKLTGKVVFWLPNSESRKDPNWNSSSLVEMAKAHPNIECKLDPRGEICKKFGVVTSGHCVVFDEEERLRYSGGLTVSRGHEGPSEGTRRLALILTDQSIEKSTLNYPVFGCSF